MNGFVKWLLSPLETWTQTTTTHKVLVGATGAAMAYYLHSRKASMATVAAISLGTAYATSLLLHAASKFETPIMASQMAAPPIQSSSQGKDTYEAKPEPIIDEEDLAEEEEGLEGIFA